MNDASKRRLTKLHPELAKRASLISELTNQGLTIEVVQGLRTFEEQNELYKEGRTKPSQVVTNSKGGQSNHNYGLAVDLCPFVNGKPQWNDNEGSIQIGVEAAKHGLEWGGNWKKFNDKPHVQLPGLTIAQCLALYNKGGLPNVWARVPPNT